jgi:hypothetical protein
MDKMKPIFLSIFFLMTISIIGCGSEKPPPVIARHEARYPDIKKKYLYQSVIRMANTSGDAAFNKLIKDVRKITIYLPPSEDSTYQIKDVSDGLRKDGYEQLIDVRTAEATRISLWANESKSTTHYMGLLDTEGEDIIFEIDGTLNLEYISSLKVADQKSLMQLVN